MNKALTLLLLGLTFNAFGQGTQTHGVASTNLDVSNINPKILTGGDAFTDLMNPGFEVPRGSGKHTIYAGALWIGGKDQQNNLYVAAQTYRQGSPPDAGYWPGPIGNVQNASHTNKYDKLWKVRKTEIQNHIANYNKPGYTMPSAIATWPGNGNTANGEAAKLAPFVDLNNDGIYSPAQGDYPKTNGDQAIYLILNDKGNEKKPVSAPMNAEIHVMHYGFDNSNNSAVFHTLFTEYRIINRGQINLQDFYAGVWMDFDLGYYNDDYVGCDTIQNRFFVYNGDNDDEGPSGYGLNPPQQSVIFLDKKMSHFIYYNNDSNPTNGNPTRASDFYNYMRGVWRDGNLVTQWGDGTNQANPPAAYMFPGGLNGGWSEVNTQPNVQSSNTPSDRRGVGSIGPFNLKSGQELKFTVAYNYSRGNATTSSFVTAAQDAQTVQNFFNNTVLLGKSEKITGNQTLKLFPNPATAMLHIQLPNTFENKEASISITDYTGRVVLQTKTSKTSSNQQLNIAALSKGIYQVTITSPKQTISSKLVKL